MQIDDHIGKVLKRLEKRSRLEKTHKTNTVPARRMLAITKETGEMINMLLLIMNAKNVLEIGTSVGYSTLWCADAVKRNTGTIFTIERDAYKISRAEKNFADARVSKNIEVLKGEALEILELIQKRKDRQYFFDFVLIDADKENVTRYFDLAAPLVRRGGIIMTDNMLYPEKYKKEMNRLSRHIRNNAEFRTITCPVGNGEEISVRI